MRITQKHIVTVLFGVSLACAAGASQTGGAAVPGTSVAVRSAAGITAGTEFQNGTAIYKYLRNAGYSPMQAAGATCSMWGEDGWDPESWSVDTNGLYSGGIMQWNGSNYPDYVGQAKPTGNATADLDLQLPAIIRYVQDRGKQGYVTEMASAPSILAASQIWSSNVEEAGSSDAHLTGAELTAQIAKNVDGVTLPPGSA